MRLSSTVARVDSDSKGQGSVHRGHDLALVLDKDMSPRVCSNCAPCRSPVSRHELLPLDRPMFPDTASRQTNQPAFSIGLVRPVEESI